MSDHSIESNGFIRKLFEGFSDGPQFEFLKDTLQKTTVFLVIAFVAVGLNLLVHLLKKIDVSVIILYGIEALEYLIFAADMIWFVTYLVVTTTQMVKSVVAHAHKA